MAPSLRFERSTNGLTVHRPHLEGPEGINLLENTPL